MATACITTMRDQTCLVLCKPHFSLAIWHASAMASFSCLGLSVFVPLCSLFVTFTGRSSVNSGLSWVVPSKAKEVSLDYFPILGAF
ncbi:hypothetical protein FH972_026792 [Carpinus fangiana]|uniref:Uncharacterized protein n=1 Tax=Carpinus fangiana TaxID=176857 RepID=A0A5N6L528_9ROSI|nr:hypothetical protein FH972_026792 [Carpinus fangiana]